MKDTCCNVPSQCSYRHNNEFVVEELKRISIAIHHIDDIPTDCKVISDGDYHPSCDSKKCAECLVDNLIKRLQSDRKELDTCDQCC